MKSGERRTFASLALPGVRLWFAGQTLSFMGNWAQVVAQATLVNRLSGSGRMLGLIAMVQFGPVLVLGAYGGVLADRLDRRLASIATNVALAVATASLGLLTISGHVRLWHVFAIAAVMGVLNSFDHPLRQTMVHDLVGPDHIANAVSLQTVINNIARVSGPALAALLITSIGIGWSFIANAVTFVAMAFALVALRERMIGALAKVRSPDARLREGFAYVRRQRRLLVPLLVMALIGTFTYEFSVFLPLLATHTFERGDGDGYALLSVGMGAGAIVGGLIGASRIKPTLWRFLRSAIVFGSVVLVASLMPNIWITMAALTFVGASSVTFIALASSVLQVNAADEMRGRVMSLYTVALVGTTPIGAPIVGELADRTSPRVAMMLAGATAIVAGLAGLATLRDELRHGR